MSENCYSDRGIAVATSIEEWQFAAIQVRYEAMERYDMHARNLWPKLKQLDNDSTNNRGGQATNAVKLPTVLLLYFDLITPRRRQIPKTIVLGMRKATVIAKSSFELP